MSDEEELFESEEEEPDFSNSEDEWVPEKSKGKPEDDSDFSDDDDDEDAGATDDDEVVAGLSKKRGGSKKPARPKKSTFASSNRRQLYKGYKETKTKEGTAIGIPTKLNEILKKSEFKAKKMVTTSQTSKHKPQDSDSESSGDDYLVAPEDLDLDSDFFKVKPVPEKPVGEIPKGTSLSDSESETENAQEQDKQVQATGSKTIANKINQESSKAVELQEIYKRNMEFEKTKARMQAKRDQQLMEQEDVNISQLLRMGEKEEEKQLTQKTSKKRRAEPESDWESVDEEEKQVIEEPKRDLEITVELPGHVKRPKDKKQIDMEATIMRKLNRIKKENQVFLHKVHVLCWIAHGNSVNTVLNTPNLYKQCLKMLPGDRKQCYPKDKTDIKYYERIATWFKGKIKLTETTQNSSMKKLPPLATSLALQIQQKHAISKRDFVYIFVILMRAMGFHCRLVINLKAFPIRPPQEELCKISTKKLFDKYKTEGSSDKTNEKGEKTTLDELKRNKKEPSIKEPSSNNKKRKTVEETTKPNKKQKTKAPKVDQLDGGTDNVRRTRRDFGKKETNSPTITKKSEIQLVDSVEPSPRRTRNQRAQEQKENVSSLTQYNKQDKAKITSSKPQVVAEAKSSTSKISPKASTSKYSPKPSTSKAIVTPPPARVEAKTKKRVHRPDNSDDEFSPTIKYRSPPKKLKLDKIDRRVVSTDSEDGDVKNKKQKKPPKNTMDYWVEVYAETEKRWITVDLFKPAVDCVDQLCHTASQPLTYILAWNKDNSIKDISARYCDKLHTVTRKLRAEREWFDEAIEPFLGETQNPLNQAEDKEFYEIHSAKPLPTVISDFKNHPLYALERHLLKFEALYPPDAPPLGWVRKEPVYARDCVYTLLTREKWVKQARVVKVNEVPYNIVKVLKWDKYNQKILKDVPCEIFGIWQTEPYQPPTATNGVVPRNEYGNVELFKACMIPFNTVHIKLPGLNKVCKKLGVDCAPAITGFDFHSGWSHPVYDGFVVCKEFEEIVTEAWFQDQETEERKEQEKVDKRVYGNWKKLIRGLLIRERLMLKYNYGKGEDKPKEETKEAKPKKKK